MGHHKKNKDFKKSQIKTNYEQIQISKETAKNSKPIDGCIKYDLK